MVDLPNFFRVPYGPGWALVGDAGHHKDPLAARGITDAFRDAQLLADAITKGLRDGTPLATALAGYHEKRDTATIAINDLNVRAARLTGSVEEMAVIWRKLHDAELEADNTPAVTPV